MAGCCDSVGCQVTCNSCQGCDSCQVCVAGCQSTCVIAQTYNDKKISDFSNINSFSFSLTPTQDVTIIGKEDGMFNKNIWDELAEWISKRHTLPIDEIRADTNGCYNWIKQNNADGGSVVSISSSEDISPFKATEFNRISEEVNGPIVKGAYSTTDADGIGDLITADLFTRLVTSANTKKVEDGACKHCVTACDLTCDQCQKCNTACDTTCNVCQGCNSNCAATCQASCQLTCQLSCQLTCQLSCQLTCQLTCQTGLSESTS